MLALPLRAAEKTPDTLHVQVVRGIKESKPKEASWKPVGPRLTKRLARIHAWNHYFQIGHHEVRVPESGSNKVRLSRERELEIKRVSATDIELRLYLKGKLVRSSRVSLQNGITILGGDNTPDEGWFVVVRPDKPATE